MADAVPPDGGDAPPEGGAVADEAAVDDGPTTAVAVLDDTQSQLLERLSATLGDAIIAHADLLGMLVVRVRPEAWRAAAQLCRDHLECDYLSFIAGIDWMPAPRGGDEAGGDTSSPVQPTELSYGATGSTGRFQVFAYVQSTTRHWGVSLRTDCDDADPRAQSWFPVYPGADWHERECWEMYGIVFDGHPNLRHLVLPSDFEGYPLRKDFPLLARVVKPWPGLVDVEPMPGEAAGDGAEE